MKIPLSEYTISSIPNGDMPLICKDSIEFQSPWGHLIDSGIFNNNFRFEFSDVTVLFQLHEDDYLTNLEARLKKKHYKQFQKIFGQELLAYDVRRIILQTTPDEYSFSNTAIQNQLIHNILRTKHISLVTIAEDGMFTFQYQRYKGFQFGDPEKTGYVKLEIYDNSSGMMLVSIYGDFSQSDVDLFISSLR